METWETPWVMWLSWTGRDKQTGNGRQPLRPHGGDQGIRYRCVFNEDFWDDRAQQVGRPGGERQSYIKIESCLLWWQQKKKKKRKRANIKKDKLFLDLTQLSIYFGQTRSGCTKIICYVWLRFLIYLCLLCLFNGRFLEHRLNHKTQTPRGTLR